MDDSPLTQGPRRCRVQHSDADATGGISKLVWSTGLGICFLLCSFWKVKSLDVLWFRLWNYSTVQVWFLDWQHAMKTGWNSWLRLFFDYFASVFFSRSLPFALTHIATAKLCCRISLNQAVQSACWPRAWRHLSVAIQLAISCNVKPYRI